MGYLLPHLDAVEGESCVQGPLRHDAWVRVMVQLPQNTAVPYVSQLTVWHGVGRRWAIPRVLGELCQLFGVEDGSDVVRHREVVGHLAWCTRQVEAAGSWSTPLALDHIHLHRKQPSAVRAKVAGE